MDDFDDWGYTGEEYDDYDEDMWYEHDMYTEYLDKLSPSGLYLLSRKMDRDDLNGLAESRFNTYDIIDRVWKKYGGFTIKQRAAIEGYMAMYLSRYDNFGIAELIMAQHTEEQPWENYYARGLKDDRDRD